MTGNDDEKSEDWKRAAGVSRNGRQYICDHLRLMADARGEYKHLIIASPFIRGLWRAAADLLEEQPRH